MAVSMASKALVCPSTANVALARRAGPVVVAPTRRAARHPTSTPRLTSSKIVAMAQEGGGAQTVSRSNQVRNVTSKDAAALANDGWVILDVRPPNEIAKAQLTDAVEVPLFVVDDDASINNLIKQATALGMGGWWLGGSHMKPNANFLNEVQAKVPKDAKGVVVVCQKGLRSLKACEGLARAGYPSIAWINGGLDTASPGDFSTVGGKDIRYGGIGGLSEALGWTEVQQESGSSFAGGYQNVLKAFGVVLALDLVWFLWTIANP